MEKEGQVDELELDNELDLDNELSKIQVNSSRKCPVKVKVRSLTQLLASGVNLKPELDLY